MKMTAMKMNIPLTNALTIVSFAVRIMMKLAQAAREAERSLMKPKNIFCRVNDEFIELRFASQE